MPEPLVALQHVSKIFESGGWFWRRPRPPAVDAIDLEVLPGETMGIVGESGSGKSTLLRLILRLLRPTSGRILFEGRDLATLGGRELRARRRRMQVVFQDPTASFNPRQSIGRAVGAPREVHDLGTRASRRRQVGDTQELVGLGAGCPAASANGRRSRAPSSCGPRWSSPTSRPRRSTSRCRRRS